MADTVMFIHGALMTPLCWDKFIPFFAAKGYQTVAPAWPYRDHPIEELRAKPDQRLGTLSFRTIVDHYAEIIRKMDTPPILIGHSFGGLVVQMLLDRGLGKMGIAIDSAPPKGVFAFYPSVIKANMHVLLTPIGWNKVLHMSLNDFKYAFVNMLSEADQKAVYDKYVVPETGRIFFEAATAMFNNIFKIDYNNTKRAPLLLIAGLNDHIVPAAMNRQNHGKYKAKPADYKEFAGRGHWIIGQDDFEEVAAYTADWISKR
jgi:pimeloyl-ACP methyl ester carboxylesterase